MKILHTADSHIGAELPVRARLPGPRRGEDFIASFHRVLNVAREHSVDLVIHAGDLFDSPRPSRSAILAAVLPLRALADDGIPVLIVPGNHERCAIPESPFLSHQNIHIAAVPMTRLFNCGGTRVAVSAIPCLHRGAQTRFDEQLAATGWSSVAADVRILAVHQAFDSAVCGPADYRFPRKDPDVILRGQVPPEFDYVAAGHVHRHQKLRAAERLTPQFVYSGSPDRITFAEKDEPKGCVLIEVGAAGTVIHRFIEHEVRPMSVWPIPVPGLSREQLAQQIEAIVEKLPENAMAQIRIGGVLHRDAFAGMRLRERAHALRPDVIVQMSYRGIDFVAPSHAESTDGEMPPAEAPAPASPFAAVVGPDKRVHSVTPSSLGALPLRRGVYAMYDAGGRLLYVGKATNLRSRARAHVNDPSATNFFNGWTAQIARVEAILVEHDADCLALETQLIRSLRPPFNWLGT